MSYTPVSFPTRCRNPQCACNQAEKPPPPIEPAVLSPFLQKWGGSILFVAGVAGAAFLAWRFA